MVGTSGRTPPAPLAHLEENVAAGALRLTEEDMAVLSSVPNV
ncbi:hypothetical protein [Streptomyces marianii]|nr:hypothetical protein [Streptomyces marianii]